MGVFIDYNMTRGSTRWFTQAGEETDGDALELFLICARLCENEAVYGPGFFMVMAYFLI